MAYIKYLYTFIKYSELKMMKKFQNFKTHSDTETEELIIILFRKLDIDELIFLLRVLQRDIRAKYTLTKIIKKNINLKLDS